MDSAWQSTPGADDPELVAAVRARKARIKARKANPPPARESAIQRAIMDLCRWRGIFAAHIPNAGKRSRLAGKRMKGEGMRPGFPDIACYKAHAHLLIEVKRPRYSPSDVSEAQRAVHARLREEGFTVHIVTSVDDAERVFRAAGWIA